MAHCTGQAQEGRSGDGRGVSPSGPEVSYGEGMRNTLATGTLDRVSDSRKDADWVTARLDDGHVHLVWQGRLAVMGDKSSPARWRDVESLKGTHGPVLLGVLDGEAHFALDVSHAAKADVERALHEDAMLSGLREVSGLLHVDHANVLAFASGITTWHSRSRFCGACGVETEVHEAGHMRRCPACRAEHFPRTDPAVIMLVHDGANRCALGRQKIWPAGMYSTLAGFVEPGESLEDAVAREVLEEVGLVVDEVTYHSSQPWPFPQSIMLGFHARAVGGEPVANPSEIEHAQWFTADEIRARVVKYPPSTAISGVLIEDWLATQD